MKKTVVSALVEGACIRSTVRMTGVSKPTILKLICDLGGACAAFHNEHVRGLKPERITTDEIWSFIGTKGKNVRLEHEAEGCGDAWTWTAITDQKLIIAYHVGLRTQYDADEFMHEVAGRTTSREHGSTSQLERNHLTNRMGMRRFTRLTKALAKKIEYHQHAIALFFMYYNFCRVHSKIKTTPAIASGVADHVWTLEELIGLAN